MAKKKIQKNRITRKTWLRQADSQLGCLKIEDRVESWVQYEKLLNEAVHNNHYQGKVTSWSKLRDVKNFEENLRGLEKNP